MTVSNRRRVVHTAAATTRIAALAIAVSVAVFVGSTATAQTSSPSGGDPNKATQGPPVSDPSPDVSASEAEYQAIEEAADDAGALGLYRDEADGAVVVVLPADGTAVAKSHGKGQAKKTLKTFEAPLGSQVRTRTSKHDGRDVDALRKVLESRAWEKQVEKFGYGFYFDAKTEQMVVITDMPRGLLNSLERRFPGLVRIEPGAAGRATTTWNVWNDAPAFWGGAALSFAWINGRCTSGFAVNRNGYRFLVTAGHCTAAYGISGNVPVYNGNWNQLVATNLQRAPFPSYDNMIMSGGASYGPYIYTQGGASKRVNSAADAAAGYYYCFSGVISGLTNPNENCGHGVFNTSFTFCTWLGCTGDAILATGAPVPGDSGGPFYRNDGSTVAIRGIVIGYAGPYVVVEKWKWIAAAHGVSIAT